MPGVSLLTYGKLFRTLKRIVYDVACIKAAVRLLTSLERLLVYRNYDLILGVDRMGLIEAAALHDATGTPYIFLSFEIMFEEETSPRFKRLEIDASKNCRLWVVQDPMRSEKLVAQNQLDIHKQFILPLASPGLAPPSGHRLRDALGIPTSKKVAISIGSIAPWTMTKDIIEGVRLWPSDWALIIHDRYGKTRSELSRLGVDTSGLEERLYFSEHAPSMIDHLESVLGGISLGIAFYQPTYDSPYTGRNLRFVGHSSGKISTYLRHGVPVAMNENGVFSYDALEYGFGIVLEHPSQIGRALKVISATHATRASDYFANRLDFNIWKEPLLRELYKHMS
ncbi:hypothetical protein N800_03645 [Lysobacter daejeonensis GH1-9]|uniref:Glycosyltransferase family 1 protein n=1 Tax=Lysobacter daejeonensis GH1-9 TaxID=1385517 RepID=A0A0A0EXK3_9GAMM|nr:hypothetical protein N800_03645 [Lysobacter daejeonensis GH1-9]